nr:MAG: hypothetical protein DIU80_14525 [Chloroflexota bacterium]
MLLLTDHLAFIVLTEQRSISESSGSTFSTWALRTHHVTETASFTVTVTPFQLMFPLLLEE